MRGFGRLPKVSLALISGHRTLFIFVVIVLIIWAIREIVPEPTSETVEQRRARIEAQQVKLQREASEQQRTRSLCQAAELCRKFGEARQACATAGNYKNCVDIKMGKDATDLYPCMNDGHVWAEPADMPNRFQCFIQSIQ